MHFGAFLCLVITILAPNKRGVFSRTQIIVGRAREKIRRELNMLRREGEGRSDVPVGCEKSLKFNSSSASLRALRVIICDCENHIFLPFVSVHRQNEIEIYDIHTNKCRLGYMAFEFRMKCCDVFSFSLPHFLRERRRNSNFTYSVLIYSK